MTLNIPNKLAQFISVKKLTWAFTIIALVGLVGSILTYKRIQQLDAFNLAVSTSKTPESDKESFEAKFATALYLAKKSVIKKPLCSLLHLCPKLTALKNLPCNTI